MKQENIRAGTKHLCNPEYEISLRGNYSTSADQTVKKTAVK